MQNFSNSRGFSIGTVYAVDSTQYQIHTGTNSHVETDAAVLDRLEGAACLAAGHQSSERFDPPKCHPNTRIAVINDIMSWVNEPEPEKRIMWMKGPAGGGKSSIAQTIAERCYKENKLLSSFFFSRTATTSGRDDGTRLIPTIAYHLAVALPEAKHYILAKIRHNPAILLSSMGVQMRSLVVEPLKCAIMAYINDVAEMPTPQLVIIDGLDECNKPEVQSMILKVIAGILVQPLEAHLRFLIASRPEWEIRKSLNLPILTGIYLSLTLDDSYEPDRDIEIYLKSEFSAVKKTHPLGEYLFNWPSEADLKYLVRKSSGQFIYASIVIKFILNDRDNPRNRLQAMLNTSAVGISKISPYAQLDVLYIHILSTAADAAEDGYDSFYPVLEALLYSQDNCREYIFKNDYNKHSTEKLADFLDIDRSMLQLSLVDLHSILLIPSSDSPDLEIRFFHASFSDFMKDSSRSKGFFIPEEQAHISLGRRCFAIVSEAELPAIWYMRSKIQKYAKKCYFWHLKKSNFDDKLLNEIRNRDIKSFMDRIFSGFDSDYFEDLLGNIVEYRVSTDDIGCIKILPKLEKLRDIFDGILEAIDDLQDYSQADVYWSIGQICDIRRDPVNCNINNYNFDEVLQLCNVLKLTRTENPVRGKCKKFFECDKTCRDLFQDLCRNMTTPGFQDSQWWPWDWIDVMKYLLEKVEPSYHFGIFLRGELPRIRSFLVNEPIRSRGIETWYRPESSLLDLTKMILMEFKEDVYTYLKNCNVPIHEEIDFLSAVIALNEAVEEIFSEVDSKDELEMSGDEY